MLTMFERAMHPSCRTRACDCINRPNLWLDHGLSETDSRGGILVGAAVAVTNPQTGFTRSENTNASGIYTFPNLLLGVYKVRVHTQGFQTVIRSGVGLQVDQIVPSIFSYRSARWRKPSKSPPPWV